MIEKMKQGRDDTRPLLGQLRAGERQVFELLAKRKPLEEIAAKVGLSESTVSKIIHEARFALGANDDLIDDYFEMLEGWQQETGEKSAFSFGTDTLSANAPPEPSATYQKLRTLEEIESNLSPDQMRDLARSLLRLADALDQDWHPDRVQSTYLWPSSAARIEKNSLELAKRARLLVRQSELREEFLPKKLLGEPAWNILLDLFIQFSGGAKVSAKSLYVAARCPDTTALRHIERLEEAGLIERDVSDTDGRVTLFSLTKKGVVGVGRVLQRIGV